METSLPSTASNDSVDDLEVIENLRSWDFNILRVPDREVKFQYLLCMFDSTNLFDFLRIDKPVFFQFLRCLSAKYDHNDNPFHNFDHGITGT